MGGMFDNVLGTEQQTLNTQAAHSPQTEALQQGAWTPNYSRVAQTVATETPTQGSTGWRGGYNQVAPEYTQNAAGGGGGGTAPWRSGYNGVAPSYYGTQSTESQTQTTYNPNANGDQSQGPAWHPQQQYSWNSASPTANPAGSAAANPAASAGDAPATTASASGVPGYNQGNHFYDPDRSDLDAALVRSVNFPFQMMIGGISGAAFGGPIQWGLNRAADTIVANAAGDLPPTASVLPKTGWVTKIVPKSVSDSIDNAANSFVKAKSAALPSDGPVVQGAKWFQNHFNPTKFRDADYADLSNQRIDLNSKIAEFGRANAAKTADLETKYPDPTNTPAEVKTELANLRMRQQYFDNTDWQVASNGPTQLADIGKQMQARPGLFNDDEFNTFKARAEGMTESSNILKMQDEAGGIMGKGLVPNFLAGAGFVGLTMVADNYLDRLFTGSNHQEGLTDSSLTSGLPMVGGLTKGWNTNSLLLPMAFTAGEGWGPKAIAERAVLTGGALIGGKLLDTMLPTSDAQKFSQLLQPTGIDSLLMGAAFVLPAASRPQRLAMIGAAWAAGRVYNAFEGSAPIDVKDQAYKDLQADTKDRTTNSMDAAINKFKDLGQLDDQSLKLYAADWLRPGRKYENYMSAYRGAVVLTTAFGESRMDHGTLMPNTQDTFMLGGSNLDVGSQALRAFMIAQLNVKNAEAQVQKQMGQTVDGTKVSDAELTSLNQVNQQIQTQINKIYGKHDIPSAMNSIEDEYKASESGILQLKQTIENTVSVNTQGVDPQFMGKQFRDMALIDLSVAQLMIKAGNKQDAAQMLYGDTNQGRLAQTGAGNGAPKGYDGAIDELNLAAKYDPNNADLAQMQQIANQLKSQVPNAV